MKATSRDEDEWLGAATCPLVRGRRGQRSHDYSIFGVATCLIPSISWLSLSIYFFRTVVRKDHCDESLPFLLPVELWQFLYVVLTERAGAGALMWLDQSTGLFKVIDQERLSELWSDSKRRHRERTKVTRYSNLTRTLRYYYGRNLLRKGERDHVYQFLYDRMEPWISNRNLN